MRKRTLVLIIIIVILTLINSLSLFANTSYYHKYSGSSKDYYNINQHPNDAPLFFVYNLPNGYKYEIYVDKSPNYSTAPVKSGTIDNNGQAFKVIKFPQSGYYYVRFLFYDANWHYINYVKWHVTVKPSKQLSKLVIIGNSSVNENSYSYYKATAYYDDGSSKDVTNYTKWSDVSNVADIGKNTGKLTTYSVTSDVYVSISAEYTENGVTKKAQKNVKIKNQTETAKIIKAYWQANSDGTNKFIEGDKVKLTAQTEGIPENSQIRFEIFEHDYLSANDKTPFVLYAPIKKYNDGKYYAVAEWTTHWTGDGLFANSPEYTFIAQSGNLEKESENRIKVSLRPQIKLQYNSIIKRLEIILFDGYRMQLLADKDLEVNINGKSYQLTTGHMGASWTFLDYFKDNSHPGIAIIDNLDLVLPTQVTVSITDDSLPNISKTITIEKPKQLISNFTILKLNINNQQIIISNIKLIDDKIWSFNAKDINGTCIKDNDILRKIAFYIEMLANYSSSNLQPDEKPYLRALSAIKTMTDTKKQVALVGTVVGAAAFAPAGIPSVATVLDISLTARGFIKIDYLNSNIMITSLSFYKKSLEYYNEAKKLAPNINAKIYKKEYIDSDKLDDFLKNIWFSEKYNNYGVKIMNQLENINEQDFDSASLFLKNYLVNAIPFGSTFVGNIITGSSIYDYEKFSEDTKKFLNKELERQFKENINNTFYKNNCGYMVESPKDTDSDGTIDDKDAFPNDSAASIDSDNDGYPDKWNDGKSENDSTTGLSIDMFPYDSDIHNYKDISTENMCNKAGGYWYDGKCNTTAHDSFSGSLKWKFKTGDRILSSPAISTDGTIYVGSWDNHLYAINPDGSLKWKFKTGERIYQSSPAIDSDNTIYVGSSDNYLYAINPDGSLKWKFKTEHDINSSPAIGSNGTIYVGSSDNYLYAINPDGSLKWKFKTGDYIYNSSPAIGPNGTIYLGGWDNYLYAINLDGSLKWKFKTGNKIFSSPAIGSNGTIYVGSTDNYLYAINPDGSLKWKFKTGNKIFSSPAIGSNGTIYVGNDDGVLYAINPDSSLKWKFDTGHWSSLFSSPAIGSDGTIYVGSEDNYIGHYLYAINYDGSLKWKFKTGYFILSSPAIGSDGTIYEGSEDDYLYAINSSSKGLANSPWPKFHHDNQNNGNILYSSSATCDSSHLKLCITESECNKAGGYWKQISFVGVCESSCNNSHLDLCATESECEGAGGYWYNNKCNENEKITEEIVKTEDTTEPVKYNPENPTLPDKKVLKVNPVTVKLLPQMKVPDEAIGKEATLVLYIFIPNSGNWIAFPDQKISSLGSTVTFKNITKSIDFSKAKGLSFQIWYGIKVQDGGFYYDYHEVNVEEN